MATTEISEGLTGIEPIPVEPTEPSVQTPTTAQDAQLIQTIMGTDEDPRDYDLARKIFWGGVTAVTVTGVLAIILMLVYLNLATGPSNATFTWNKTSNLHIISMLMFFIFLQGYVILIFRIFPEKPKLIVKLLHFLLHVSVSVGVLVAFLSIISYKNVTVRQKDEAVHFLSLHSWLGLGAIILYYGQLIGGFVTFLLPFTPMRIRAMFLPAHRTLGTLIFMVGGAAGITGFMHKDAWKTKTFSSQHMTVQFSGVFLVLFFLGVMILVTEHRFRRRPRPEGDILLEDTSKDDD